MESNTAIITGATGAIGFDIAKGMASKGYETILAVRNEAKAKYAVEKIKKGSGNSQVRYEIVDLSSQQAILEFKERWDKPLKVLVNNAAITPRNRRESEEGIELQFATNVLGYFWMIKAFEKALVDGNPSSVVNVASYWAGDLDLEDVEFKRRAYNNNTAYRQSKQADRMLTIEFAERLKNKGISVNACHPGDVNSRLSNSLGFGGHESPEEGARTPVWLATEHFGKEKSGKYFEHQREMRCHFMEDRKATSALMALCEKYG